MKSWDDLIGETRQCIADAFKNLKHITVRSKMSVTWPAFTTHDNYGDTQVKLPDDHPMVVAFKAYKETADYRNTRNWAGAAAHVDGSLWAAFERGYVAAMREANRLVEQERKERTAAVEKIAQFIEPVAGD